MQESGNNNWSWENNRLTAFMGFYVGGWFQCSAFEGWHCYFQITICNFKDNIEFYCFSQVTSLKTAKLHLLLWVVEGNVVQRYVGSSCQLNGAVQYWYFCWLQEKKNITNQACTLLIIFFFLVLFPHKWSYVCFCRCKQLSWSFNLHFCRFLTPRGVNCQQFCSEWW